MFNTPIEWGAHSPDALEMFMAILLHQERPASFHRFPSSGDGGVDVAEPLGDGRFRVYQVKGFTGRLNVSGRKGQIRESLERAINDPRLPGAIAEWILVLPVDLTSGEEAWFNTLTAPFPLSWRGNQFWHSEASKYPYVADYYLFNQRERVQRNLHSLFEVLQDDASAGLGPLNVVDRMRTLHEAVQSASPHYRFAFSTSDAMPELTPKAGLVLSRTAGPATGPFVTLDVFERFPQATEMEPITGSIAIAVPEGVDDPEFVRALENHLTYGSELHVPQGYLNMQLEGPAGMSEVGVGGGWIGPPLSDGAPRHIRCRAGLPGGESASLRMQIVNRSVGLGGGVELSLEDEVAMLSMVVRIAPGAENVNIAFTVSGEAVSGQAAVRLRPTVEFLAALHEADHLSLLMELVESPIAVMPLTESLDLIDEPVADLVRLLARLQHYADRELCLPETIDANTMQVLRYVDQLTQARELWDEWDQLEITVTEPREVLLDRFSRPHQVMLTKRLEASLGDIRVDFGPHNLVCFSAIAAFEQPSSPDRLRLVPGPDRRRVARPGGGAVGGG